MYVSYFKSPIGDIEISADEKYVHSILFREENPEKISENHLTQLVTNQLTEYFDGKRIDFEFPMEIAGTEFQKKVLYLLKEIPFGKTISYLELAKRVGDVKSIRAVGTANGRNNFVIVLPCHRVIGSDGKLVGYGGGLWRKEWLLKHEFRIKDQRNFFSLD